jgi:2-dehydro-3-deoxyphosphogluconate aldolase/(4S)-4-hydroxy-2-oxoglutarate aldolase
MIMNDVLRAIQRLRIIPVLILKDSRDADPLAQALIDGGLPCAEITFRTDAAEASIACFAKRGDILVGAGTVLNIDQAKGAIDAGVKFVVSPGLSAKVVQYCLDHHITAIPGVCTPSDISLAIDFGLEVVKFFPSEAFGGLKTLQAISAPFSMMKFIPTGGIGIKNLVQYLSLPKVLACGGSWIAPPDLISLQKFEEITRLTAEAAGLAAKAVKQKQD